MVRIGTLKDFRASVNKLKKEVKTKSSITITVTAGGWVRKVKVNNEEALSIVRLRGTSWAFRYNPKFWQNNVEVL
jgi:hypothetical protein